MMNFGFYKPPFHLLLSGSANLGISTAHIVSRRKAKGKGTLPWEGKNLMKPMEMIDLGSCNWIP